MTIDKKIQSANNDPTIFIVTPTTDLYDLERQYKIYLSLPIDDMRMSDDKAQEIYGKTNQDMYMQIRSEILDPPLVTEGFVAPEGETLESMKRGNDALYDQINNPPQEMIEKIKHSIEENSYYMVIIYPFTKAYPYTLNDLEAAYNRFNALPHDLQSESNEHSFAIFGMEVPNMYHAQKNILLSIIDDEEERQVRTEYDRFAENTLEYASNATELSLLKKQLELLNMQENGSYMDGQIASTIKETFKDLVTSSSTISDTVPEFTPFLTPTEIEDCLDGELTPDAQIFIDEYRKSMANGLADFDGNKYKDTILELFSKFKNEKQSYTIKEAETKLISCGWNPNVNPTDKSFKYAKDRIVRYMNENYKVHISDISDLYYLDEKVVADKGNEDLDMYPVYLVLTYTQTAIGAMINKVVKSTYSHASISFNSSLNPLYSYARHGLYFDTVENIVKEHPEGICKVIVTFITRKQREKIMTGLDYYISNHNKTTYAVDNLFAILFNQKVNDKYSLRQVCSQFVNQLLRMANVNLFDNKSNNLVTPNDFDKSTSSKLYIVYEGRIDKYNNKKTNFIVDDLLMNTSNMTMKKYTLNEAVAAFRRNHFSSYEKQLTCIESETEANEILEQMHDLMCPESVLVEAKRIPIQVNSKGIIIDMPIRIEEQYQEIHKTMLMYEKQKAYEQMKPELARLWYLNLVSERKIKGKIKRDKKEDAKKLRDTRARIMNDFKKYLKLLLTVQPDFDFATYFEGSRYNDRKLFVDKETLINSGIAIAKIVKTIMAG